MREASGGIWDPSGSIWKYLGSLWEASRTTSSGAGEPDSGVYTPGVLSIILYTQDNLCTKLYYDLLLCLASLCFAWLCVI